MATAIFLFPHTPLEPCHHHQTVESISTALETGWQCGDSFKEHNEAEVRLHDFQGYIIIALWFHPGSLLLFVSLSLVYLRPLTLGMHSPCCEDAWAT